MDAIPTVCRIDDVCRILQMARRTFHFQRARGTFPIPEIQPRLCGGPRFSGDLLARYIAGEFAGQKHAVGLVKRTGHIGQGV